MTARPATATRRRRKRRSARRAGLWCSGTAAEATVALMITNLSRNARGVEARSDEGEGDRVGTQHC
jgi:hypothetical protein